MTERLWHSAPDRLLAHLRRLRYTSVCRSSEWGFTEAGASPARPRHCNGHVGAQHAAPAAQRHWATGKAGRTPGARRRLHPRHLRFPRGRDGGARASCAHALAHLRSDGGGLSAMRRWAHRTHLAGLLAILAACGAAGGGQGRAAIAGPARRIVSLSPAVTELLFALGAGDRVVGRTTWCDYPPEVRQVP